MLPKNIHLYKPYILNVPTHLVLVYTYTNTLLCLWHTGINYKYCPVPKGVEILASWECSSPKVVGKRTVARTNSTIFLGHIRSHLYVNIHDNSMPALSLWNCCSNWSSPDERPPLAHAQFAASKPKYPSVPTVVDYSNTLAWTESWSKEPLCPAHWIRSYTDVPENVQLQRIYPDTPVSIRRWTEFLLSVHYCALQRHRSSRSSPPTSQRPHLWSNNKTAQQQRAHWQPATASRCCCTRCIHVAGVQLLVRCLLPVEETSKEWSGQILLLWFMSSFRTCQLMEEAVLAGGTDWEWWGVVNWAPLLEDSATQETCRPAMLLFLVTWLA